LRGFFIYALVRQYSVQFQVEAVKRFSGRSLGVEQGSAMLFSDFEDGGAMWSGSGERELRHEVVFSEPFAGIPIVMVGMSMWDLDQKTNQRADLSAHDITAQGFTMMFKTWGDTRVARVRAGWTAMGELSDDDDWDVE
jgi:hypothetical protein